MRCWAGEDSRSLEMSWAVSSGPRRLHDATYIHIVVELDAPRAVELDLLQGLAHDIVGLVLRLLRGLDDGALVEVALVVEVELAEGVLQPEDLALLELRVFPAPLAWRKAKRRTWRGTHFCSLMMFMMAELARRGGGGLDGEERRARVGRESAWLRLVVCAVDSCLALGKP